MSREKVAPQSEQLVGNSDEWGNGMGLGKRATGRAWSSMPGLGSGPRPPVVVLTGAGRPTLCCGSWFAGDEFWRIQVRFRVRVRVSTQQGGLMLHEARRVSMTNGLKVWRDRACTLL